MKLKHVQHTRRHLPPRHQPPRGLGHEWSTLFHICLDNALGMGVEPSKNRKTQGWRGLGWLCWVVKMALWIVWRKRSRTQLVMIDEESMP